MSSRPLTSELVTLAHHVAGKCSNCESCKALCRFLDESGSPKIQAERSLSTGRGISRAFECSLCGLCETVCPQKLPLKQFFLAMRRFAQTDGRMTLAPYRPLLTYESVGGSSVFRLFQLPAGGNTIFFPGCTFPGIHMKTSRALLARLTSMIPDLGLVLGCCFKPSHDLGRQDYFLRRFGELRHKLLSRGVTTILTACPNCFKVFAEYGEGLAVHTVYEALINNQNAHRSAIHGRAIVHTPCPYRGREDIQGMIRTLAEDTGMDVEKTRQDGNMSPCCGEGGAVGALRPDLAARWMAGTAERAGGRLVVTSCAGCVKMLSTHARAVHILDLLFFPREAMAAALYRPNGLPTYGHRLLFKVSALLNRT